MKCQLSLSSTNHLLFSAFLANLAYFSLGWPASLYFSFRLKGGKEKVLDRQAGLHECARRKFQKVELDDSWSGTGLGCQITRKSLLLFVPFYIKILQISILLHFSLICGIPNSFSPLVLADRYTRGAVEQQRMELDEQKKWTRFVWILHTP